MSSYKEKRSKAKVIGGARKTDYYLEWFIIPENLEANKQKKRFRRGSERYYITCRKYQTKEENNVGN